MSSEYPRIGVGVFVFRHGKFLMGERRGAHGEGSWSVPGGHLEYGETPQQTAAREISEETGLSVGNIRFGGITNDIFHNENKHYVTIWMLSDHQAGEPELREPDTYINMDWFSFEDLPQPLFLPWQQLLKSDYITSIKKELRKSYQR